MLLTPCWMYGFSIKVGSSIVHVRERRCGSTCAIAVESKASPSLVDYAQVKARQRLVGWLERVAAGQHQDARRTPYYHQHHYNRTTRLCLALAVRSFADLSAEAFSYVVIYKLLLSNLQHSFKYFKHFVSFQFTRLVTLILA